MHTLGHEHTWAQTHIYIHASYSFGQVAQQTCNLASIQEWWYRTQIQPNNFRGDWSWDSFYSHSLLTAESSKAVVINWLFVMTKLLRRSKHARKYKCRLTVHVQHYLNCVYLYMYFFLTADIQVIEIKLMNYFSLTSKNLKLEHNEAFSAEIRKLFDVSRIQLVQEMLDTATERDLWSLHFSIQFMKRKNNVLQILGIKYA